MVLLGCFVVVHGCCFCFVLFCFCVCVCTFVCLFVCLFFTSCCQISFSSFNRKRYGDILALAKTFRSSNMSPTKFGNFIRIWEKNAIMRWFITEEENSQFIVFQIHIGISLF